MHVFGSPVLTSSVFAWSHQALMVAMKTGARLVAGVAAVAGSGRDAPDQPRLRHGATPPVRPLPLLRCLTVR